jgi:translation initiation factor IF-2
VFLDTGPPHSRRCACGARPTVVLVVAADDRRDAADEGGDDHAAANVPIVVAINKIDKSTPGPKASSAS